jgi:hypothetical protein
MRGKARRKSLGAKKHAAVVLQSAMRGKKAQVVLAGMKKENEEATSKNTAITKLQSTMRGKARRKSLAAKKHAAVVLQSAIRKTTALQADMDEADLNMVNAYAAEMADIGQIDIDVAYGYALDVFYTDKALFREQMSEAADVVMVYGEVTLQTWEAAAAAEADAEDSVDTDAEEDEEDEAEEEEVEDVEEDAVAEDEAEGDAVEEVDEEDAFEDAMEDSKEEEEEEDLKDYELDALTTIQTTIRGNARRKSLGRKKHAAVVLQSVQRGKKAQTVLAVMKQVYAEAKAAEEKAAEEAEEKAAEEAEEKAAKAAQAKAEKKKPKGKKRKAVAAAKPEEEEEEEATGVALIGRRVEVLGLDDQPDDWFAGTITKFNKRKRSYTIVYDIGDEEDGVTLPDETVRFIAQPAEQEEEVQEEEVQEEEVQEEEEVVKVVKAKSKRGRAKEVEAEAPAPKAKKTKIKIKVAVTKTKAAAKKTNPPLTPKVDPSSLKVVELREELKKLDLSTKGKKAELIVRLTEALA